MKIRVSQLRKIIAEEAQKVLRESPMLIKQDPVESWVKRIAFITSRKGGDPSVAEALGRLWDEMCHAIKTGEPAPVAADRLSPGSGAERSDVLNQLRLLEKNPLGAECPSGKKLANAALERIAHRAEKREEEQRVAKTGPHDDPNDPAWFVPYKARGRGYRSGE